MMVDDRQGQCRNRTGRARLLRLVSRLKGCQSQGMTIEETLVNIREAIELFLETLTEEERSAALSREILTTAVEVHA